MPVELLAILQREIDERLKRDKDTVTVRFDDGAFTVVADLPKRVDRDRVLRATTVERIRARFTPARPVRTGALKSDLKAPGGEQ